MKIDELKSHWQKSSYPAKSSLELKMMTKVRNHPKLARIRIKLIIEVTLLVAFIALYKDLFDGGAKPLWVNISLGVSVALFIINDIVGYFTIQDPIRAGNIKSSINTLIPKLKRLSILSITSSLFFGLCLILFFSSTIDFTQEKYLMLAGMLITLIIFSFVSHRNWFYRIKHFQKVEQEFNEDPIG